ncbi:MAG TPA: hypothetical protein VME19_17720 [Streptosporangiaceae bacterium]|nr:hypothetical protein [Streptosporangiaceae bacterium]
MGEPEPEPEPVSVYLTTAVRTSGGNGPGVVRVPLREAQAIVNTRRGVFGDQPPRGFIDGGADPGEAARMMPRSGR